MRRMGQAPGPVYQKIDRVFGEGERYSFVAQLGEAPICLDSLQRQCAVQLGIEVDTLSEPFC